MIKDIPEPLRDDCLTSIEDYRKMQVKIHMMKKDNEPVDRAGKSEEWKNWKLAPLDASVKQEEERSAEPSDKPSSEAVASVHKALRKIDKF